MESSYENIYRVGFINNFDLDAAGLGEDYLYPDTGYWSRLSLFPSQIFEASPAQIPTLAVVYICQRRIWHFQQMFLYWGFVAENQQFMFSVLHYWPPKRVRSNPSNPPSYGPDNFGSSLVLDLTKNDVTCNARIFFSWCHYTLQRSSQQPKYILQTTTDLLWGITSSYYISCCFCCCCFSSNKNTCC